MRFGVLLVLVIAVGAALGWALSGSGASGSDAPVSAAAEVPTPVQSTAAPEPAPDPATFSATAFVNRPVHFAYAVLLHEVSKDRNSEVKADRDQRIVLSMRDDGAGAAKVTVGFTPEGSGTRIALRVDATGSKEAQFRKDLARGRSEPMDRVVQEIEKAAKEVETRMPGYSLNRAADLLLDRAAERRRENEARADAEASSAAAENAAAALR